MPLLADNSNVATLVKPVEDNYEDNNDMSEPYTGLADGVWLYDVDGYGISKDEDWFLADVSNPAKLRIKIECLFSHAEGDIDIVFYNSTGGVVDEKLSITDNEYINVVVPSTGLYFIRVWNRATYTGNSYDLRWTSFPEDNYEPNNTLAGAFTGLPINTWLSTVDGPGYQGDIDWYKIVVTDDTKRRVVVDCTFLHSEGDIDISLYNSSGTQLYYNSTLTDNEQIDFVVPSTGAYYVKVTSFEYMESAYDLRWNTLTYLPPTLLSLSISGVDQLYEHDSAQYTCTATYSDDSTSDVTVDTGWSVSQFASIGSSGLLTASEVLSDQSVTITVVYGGKSASKNVTIKDIPLAVLELTINGASEVNENSTASYICTATWSDCSTSDVTALTTWSTGSSCASIEAGSLCAGDVSSDESITITAVYGGQSATKSVLIKQTVTEEIYYMSWVFLEEVPLDSSNYEDIVADDGIPNLLKYACGLPPLQYCTSADLMKIADDSPDGMFTINYNRAESAVDVELEVLWAPTPSGPWTPVEMTEKISQDGDIQLWKASIPTATGRGFMRLRATPVESVFL